MFDKLSFIEERFAELEKKIADPEIISNQELWRKLCKEHSDISPIVEKYKEYKLLNENISEAKEMLADSSLDKDEKDLIEDEIDDSKKSAAYQLLDKDMNCHGHMHLKCSSCGTIMHLGCEFMSNVGQHILEHHSFKIDNSRTIIYGLCGACREKGNK